MKVAVAARWILRESRGAWGRMTYFAACIAVGVAAVVGTAAVSQAVERGFRERSREILGADLSVNSRRALPPSLDAALARRPDVERTDVIETASMAAAPTEDGGARGSTLVQVVSVAGRWPLRGELTTDPPGGLAAHLGPDAVVAAPDALSALGLRVGDELVLGGARLRVTATVVRAPPQFGFSALLGPRVYVSAAAFARTKLTGFGTRARHVAMIALKDAAPERLAALEAEIRALPGGEYLDVDSHLEIGPGGGRTNRRIQGFVGLAALLSMIVGGIGVAQIVSAWVAGRTRAIAVLRCLGVRPVEILLVSLGHLALLGLVGSAVGAALGCALPSLVAWAEPDVVPGGLPTALAFGAAARGLLLGVGVALLFGLPPLLAVWRVPPARALRADAAPLPAPRAATAAAAVLLAGGVFVAALVLAGSPLWALSFTIGFAALVGALHAGARGIVRLASALPRGRMNPYLRHGVAALARPGAGTAGSTAALGLGAMVVAAMALVHAKLADGLLAQVPENAPSVFLVDVQPDQWKDVSAALEEAGARNVEHVPVVTARITSIDGRPVEELARGGEGAGASRRGLTRELRLTSRAELDPSNRVVKGALWSDPARAELSLEERFARDLGVDVGSTIVFDVQGVPVELRVTSLRAVEWQSFAINFFLVVEPGVLDRAPGLVLASARVPPAAEPALQDVVASRWPSVSVIRVGAILDEVGKLLRRVVAGVAALGSFCVASGLLVLAGAASAAALRRRREVALLKALGVTRLGVAALLAVEYALVGAVAGLVGAAGAWTLAWGFLRFVAELPADVPLLAVPGVALVCAAASAVCGVAASARALRVPPIEALR